MNTDLSRAVRRTVPLSSSNPLDAEHEVRSYLRTLGWDGLQVISVIPAGFALVEALFFASVAPDDSGDEDVNFDVEERLHSGHEVNPCDTFEVASW